MELKYLKGVGPKRAEAFGKIGITSLYDFLNLTPRDYIARININQLQHYFNGNVLVHGKIFDIVYPHQNHQPVKIFIQDGTGSTEIPIFGDSEFRAKQFQLNQEFVFWGKVSEGFRNSRLKLDYRDHLKVDDEQTRLLVKYKLIPVYELSGLLKKTWIKPLLLTKIVFGAFNTLVKSGGESIHETLPENILTGNELTSRQNAVLRINFPLKQEDIEVARRRLAFEELFYLELLMALKKNSYKETLKGISFINSEKSYREKFLNSLPFELTNAQKKVIAEIMHDMTLPKPMNRLLQGDVGSGKTVVAISSMLNAIDNGYQSAFMCPTEILAQQHFVTLKYFLDKIGIKTVLLIGGQKKALREELLNSIKSCEANIVVGTHALIQDAVEFNKLGIVVIDEQHKFGVMQRAKLREKGENPDTLIMTATPIPRTLSLTVYGDLDVSIIDELPKNRKNVKTVMRSEADRKKVYDFINKEIKSGRQAYIIYPLIDESEKLDLKSAEENYVKLKNEIFPELRVGMVHGRVLWYEKDEEMENFKGGKLDILVATTVIEVGIDIPNATVMLIEDAHRFGLSQLHQLRGRVGRGAEQSYCILMSDTKDETANKRLNLMCITTDGFKIAEEDMNLRGPGEFFGLRQSGMLNLSYTDLSKDKTLLFKARDAAFKIIEKDPQLRNKENFRIRENFIKNYKDSLYLVNIA